MDLNVDQTLIQKWAPLIRFSRYEKHCPTYPDYFRRTARFRESNYDEGRDRGWNRTGLPTDSDLHDPEYYGLEWPLIHGIVHDTIRSLPRPQAHPITRPHDESNAWGGGSERGFFLELHDDRTSEVSATTDNRSAIYHDAYEYSRGGPSPTAEWIAISYWYFFLLNWNVVTTHEGDWEHITLYFNPATFPDAALPDAVFFASHNHGKLAHDDSFDEVLWEGSHPVVFVSPWGHASNPRPFRPTANQYSQFWRTWERPIPRLVEQPWFNYGGAWGEVGEVATTTGPLGPWFKRGRDKAPVRRMDRPVTGWPF